MTFQSSFARRHIPAYARADIKWWLTYARSWNRIQILEPKKPTMNIYTDTSGSKGLGGTFEDHQFSARCPHRFHSCDIQFEEIYAVLQAIIRWGHLWKHNHVIFNIDNTTIVYALASGTNRNRPVMNVTWMIIMLAAQLEFSYSSFWISSDENSIADSACHFQYTCMFLTAHHL